MYRSNRSLFESKFGNLNSVFDSGSEERLNNNYSVVTQEEKDLIMNNIDEIRRRNEMLLLKPPHGDEVMNDIDTEVYEKFDFGKISSDLPIYSSKTEILNEIAKNSTIIIIGNTGCGKTTQVPQMILDDAFSKRKPCNIIVTQPRRIAARSVAQRVCSERQWELGKLVGYQVGLDKRFISDETRITFCTTGILLERLISSKKLDKFTHIILDEVHNRDKEMDFLFIIIRLLMYKSPHVKLILMSATINPEQFSAYFKNPYTNKNAPIIRIKEKNKYNVKISYIEDIIPDDSNFPSLQWNKPGIPEVLYDFVPKFIEKRTTGVVNNESSDHLSSILIFLPGIYEIACMHTSLLKFMQVHEYPNHHWEIAVLHSMISYDEQKSVFDPVKNGGLRIILATNIAESSLTIDVRFVIDFCLTKHIRTSVNRNFSSLELEWASKNSIRQRSGRCARIADGEVYRMIPRKIFNWSIEESETPEILRTPLENIILKIKKFGQWRIHVVLGLAMDPPKIEDVVASVNLLKSIGGLSLTSEEDNLSIVDGDITGLGTIMEALPIDVRAAKLIALGYCFGILEETIIIAATLTVKNIFKLNFHKTMNPYNRLLEWSYGSGSDLFAAYNAYQMWTVKYNQREFGKRPEQRKAENEFCLKHNLDMRSLHECHQLVNELKKRLDKLGIHSQDNVQLSDREKAIIMKVVISGAFYPNFFAIHSNNNAIAERRVLSELNYRDPRKTVYFSGFESKYARELYINSIKNLFKNNVVHKECLDYVHISFDSNSEKVFVTFEMDIFSDISNESCCSIPSRILPEVYKAIKMRQLALPTEIQILPEKMEIDLAIKHGIDGSERSIFIQNKGTLSVDIEHEVSIEDPRLAEIEGVITHIATCSKFWLQPATAKADVDSFAEILNKPNCHSIEPIFDDGIIEKKLIIAARNLSDDRLYRARLLNQFDDVYTVLFIDFGYTQDCSKNDLYTIHQNIDAANKPARCFECCLAEIQPNATNLNGGHKWEFEAIEKFRELVLNKTVSAEVFSVVDGVINVFVKRNDINVNDILIGSGYGEHCEETYRSKENRSKRLEHREMLKYMNDDDVLSFLKSIVVSNQYDRECFDAKKITIPKSKTNKMLRLHGPKSPLETTMTSVLKNIFQNAVNVDKNSINSVLLSPIQQQSNIRYLVAATVSQSASSAAFIANDTTLLPDIRGFGPLMAMIFAPKIDLERDQTQCQYISVLTGLGISPKNRPFFPEHDAFFQFDFVLDNDDIDQINGIRYCLSKVLSGVEECFRDENAERIISKNIHELKMITIRLLTKNRKPGEICEVLPHEWKLNYSNEFKPPTYNNTIDMLPSHGTWILKNRYQDVETSKRLRSHCADLHEMITYNTFQGRQITCELCGIKIEDKDMLRVHLMTRLHKDRENEIGFKV